MRAFEGLILVLLMAWFSWWLFSEFALEVLAFVGLGVTLLFVVEAIAGIWKDIQDEPETEDQEE